MYRGGKRYDIQAIAQPCQVALKSEYRISKSETNSNIKLQKLKTIKVSFLLLHVGNYFQILEHLKIRILILFRISYFVFRI